MCLKPIIKRPGRLSPLNKFLWSLIFRRSSRKSPLCSSVTGTRTCGSCENKYETSNRSTGVTERLRDQSSPTCVFVCVGLYDIEGTLHFNLADTVESTSIKQTQVPTSLSSCFFPGVSLAQTSPSPPHRMSVVIKTCRGNTATVFCLL